MVCHWWFNVSGVLLCNDSAPWWMTWNNCILSRQRGGIFTPQCSFCRKSPTKQWINTVSFRDIVTDPFGFLTPWSVSLYLLPVLRGRSASNVHETGFPTRTNETALITWWEHDVNIACDSLTPHSAPVFHSFWPGRNRLSQVNRVNPGTKKKRNF